MGSPAGIPGCKVQCRTTNDAVIMIYYDAILYYSPLPHGLDTIEPVLIRLGGSPKSHGSVSY